MRKKLMVIFLTALLVFGTALTAFAASPELIFASSYDAEQGVVIVSISVKNAVGSEAADLSLAYDTSMYSFENAVESDGVGGIVVAGKSVYEDGIATCSFLFMDACDEEDLDENGELALAVYTFKPLSDDYDLDAFCLWATSYSISDTEIVEQVKTFGQTDLKESHTVKVTAKPEESAPSSSGSVKWYVYVIATVLAVGVIVGIAVVAVKNAQKHEEENAGNRRSGTDGEHEEKSETAQTSDASDESDQSGE